MASLHKRVDSPYWVIAYTDAKGRRLKKSSKSKSYEEAKRIAREWEEAIRLAKKKRLVAKQSQAVLREVLEGRTGPQAVASTSKIAPDSVPNQREIARFLQVSQATVSMALRGDRSISLEIRRKVQKTAAQMGYHSNAYVNVLMSRIRSGKRLSDKGVIAMLVDATSKQDWHLIESYRLFHQGVIHRSSELGFEIETFFYALQTCRLQ